MKNSQNLIIFSKLSKNINKDVVLFNESITDSDVDALFINSGGLLIEKLTDPAEVGR